MDILYSITSHAKEKVISPNQQAQNLTALEQGRIIYLPEYAMPLHAEEQFLLSPDIKAGQAKNISYSSQLGKIKHTALAGQQLNCLAGLLARYGDYATALIAQLLPSYVPHLNKGRTSFRPIEIEGRRPASYKKDDTRLHVDAFPASPTQGQRILRVFCNINPDNKPRVWHVGEPFSDVAAQFLPRIPAYSPFRAKMLEKFKLTKSYRTAYDHYMLGIHDGMKKDLVYQANVNKKQIDFPSSSTWIVYTDQVSHAALSGQYLLEQTFYLPPNAMAALSQTPQYIVNELLKHA
ncbi:MAG: Kdo hydroxylase family protein [Gammaproteobacteria bacterium]|nr:Kdo hydroxylase family protein [Gammaproteobacteria bacterium]